MGKTATAVYTETNWQALYIGDKLAYQNHSVELRNFVTAIDEADDPITESDDMLVDIDQIGGGHLPGRLSHLNEMLSFRDRVEENIETWEERARDIILSSEEPPTRDELQEQVELNDREFRVLTALLTPAGIRTTKTPLDREAVIAYVENSTSDDARFTLASSENARI